MSNEQALETEIIRLKKENEQLKQSLTVLSEKNSELEAIVNAFPDLIFWLRSDSTIIKIKTGYQALEKPSELNKFLEQKLTKIILNKDAKKIEKAIENVVKNKYIQPIEYGIYREEKTEFYQGNLMPFAGDRLLMVVRNVTEQKQAEIERQRLIRVLDCSADFIAITSVTQSSLLYVNEAGCKLVGLKDFAEIKNKKVSDFYIEEEQKIMHDTILPQVMKNGNWQGEVTWRNWANQQTIPIDQSIFIIKEPETEEIIGLATISRDITERKQAEKTLRRQALLLDQVKGAIIATDLKGMITYWSKGSAELLGYENEEVLGQHINIIYPELQNKLLLKDVILPLQKDGQQETETKLKTKSGEKIDVFISLSLERDETGNIIGMIGYAIDITEQQAALRDRKKTEIELENATQQMATQANLLRSVIDSTSDWIFVKNQQFQYILVNHAFARIIGKNIDEIIGKNDLELGFPPELVFGDPEKGIRGFRTDDQEVLTGKTLHNPYDPATDVNGNIIIFDTQKMPLKDSEGNYIGIIGMCKDLTERHEAQMKLKESNQVLESIFNTLPQRIFWKDKNFRFLGGNKLLAQDAGFESSEQIIGKDDFEMSWKDSAHLYRSDDAKVMTSGIAKINFDEPQILENGQTLWLRTSKIPLRNEQGEIIGIFGCYEDITERKNAQVKLKEQEQLLRTIYDGINHPIFVVDVLENGQFQQVGFNRAAEMATGLKREEIFNKTMAEIFPPEQAEKISQDFENCLRLGTSFSYEEYQNFQGEELWSFTTINPIKDEQGKIYRIVGTAMNITDRKKAEELLRQSEERFRGLVETINDWIWEIDANGVYTYISPQIELILGYKPEEIIGKTPFDLMSPAEVKRVEETFNQKIKNKQTLKQIENINIHKEGYEVVIETSGVPVLDGEGNLTGYRGIDRDISDRKKQEKSLKLIVEGTAAKTGAEFFRSCTQYLAQVLQVRYAFIIEHKSGNLVETLAGWNGEGFIDNFQYQLPGTPCELLYKNNKQNNVVRYIHSVQSYFPEDQDLAILQAESYAGIAIKDNAGNILGHIAVLDTNPLEENLEMQSSILEIFAARAGAEIERMQAENALIKSENKLRQQKQALEETLHQLQRTQTQLIQSEKMSSLGQLVAGVAHEINNPVNFIHGNISHADQYIEDLLKLQDMYNNYYTEVHPDILDFREEIDLDFIKEDLTKVFKSMRVGTERIREIVKSLRNFSRLDEAEFKPVNIHDGIDSTLMILQTRLKEKQDRKPIQVIKEYGELPPVECYAGQLNQVFMNILSNAIDALDESDRPAASMIKITTKVIENNFISIIFNDNGPGIKSETVSKLFDPFFTTKPVGQGTGLGLSISYQIITERHKGKLYCNSQPGSTNFIIEIPIIQNR